MPSFEKILTNTPIGNIKDPPPFPVGSYICVTSDAGTWGESRVKKTKQIAWRAKILQPHSDVDQQKLMEWKDETGESVSGQEIYPTFYSDSRVAEFLRALGFEESVPGPEAIANSAGRQFVATFRHEPSMDGKRIVATISGYAAV
jgi:hypothetical protein